jgi:hypothetical protein
VVYDPIYDSASGTVLVLRTLNGILGDELGHEADGVRAVSVLGDLRREKAVQESQHVRRVLGVLGPAGGATGVGIEIGDEVDEIFGKISGNKGHSVRSVELGAYSVTCKRSSRRKMSHRAKNWEAFEPLAH